MENLSVMFINSLALSFWMGIGVDSRALSFLQIINKMILCSRMKNCCQALLYGHCGWAALLSGSESRPPREQVIGGEGNSLCLGTGPFPLVSVKPGVQLSQEQD